MQKTIRLLTSTRLAIILLIIFILANFIGVTFQNKINDPFRSWWFITLLITLATNMAFCTWRRFLNLKHNADRANPVAAYSRWGSVLFHFSMVLILLGGAVNQLWGYRGQIILHEKVDTGIASDIVLVKKGYLAKPPAAQTMARLDKFKIFLAEPKKYAQLDSRVSFFNDLSASRQLIQVNHPGDFAGLSWRYKEYGFAPLLKLQKGKQENYNTYFNLGAATSVGEPRHYDEFNLAEGLTAEIEFIPAAVKNQPTKPTQSYAPKNPAVHVVLKAPGKKIYDQYLPLKGKVEKNGYKVTFQGYRYWVLFDISANPGEYVIIIGFTLCLLGLTLRFLFRDET